MSNYTTPINRLPLVSNLSPGDQLHIYSPNTGDDRRVPVSVLQTFVNTPQNGIVSVYSAPSTSPFTFTFPSVNSNMWLVLTPTGTMANGTLALPGDGVAVDHQNIDVSTTQAVTVLAVTASGLTVTGAPTTLTAGQVFRMRYDGVTKTWYMAP